MRKYIIQTQTQASLNLKIQFQKQFLKCEEIHMPNKLPPQKKFNFTSN